VDLSLGPLGLFHSLAGQLHFVPLRSTATDQAAAAEVIGSAAGLVMPASTCKDEPVAYLHGLTGGINHVVLDPLDGKRAGFVRLRVFIQTLDAAQMASSRQGGSILVLEVKRQKY
jgi:hypothetical protein